MNAVYVVIGLDYSEFDVLGTFSSQSKAEQAADGFIGLLSRDFDEIVIEVHDVDPSMASRAERPRYVIWTRERPTGPVEPMELPSEVSANYEHQPDGTVKVTK